jgi:membrane-associated protease RseP (regulator of RpoE activity)
MDPIPNAITWWYDTPFGDITWVIVKMLYWLFWLDILLAISNALPAYPFDGGFLFEGGINWLLERLGFKEEEKRKKLSDSISSSISTIVLVMFFLVLLAFVI